jgi:histidinol phosphatase-like enzyme
LTCAFNSDVLRGCCRADHTPTVTLCDVQWLTILPEDDEKTRTKKKKLIKSYKSKMRFAKLDQETKVGEHAIELVKGWHGVE